MKVSQIVTVYGLNMDMITRVSTGNATITDISWLRDKTGIWLPDNIIENLNKVTDGEANGG